MAIKRLNPIVTGGVIKAECATLAEANLLKNDMDMGDLILVNGLLHYKGSSGSIVPSEVGNIHTTVLDIGPWNMQSTSGFLELNIDYATYGIKSPEQILNASGYFQMDNKNYHWMFGGDFNATHYSYIAWFGATPTSITLRLVAVGTEWNSASYSSVAINRGQITLKWIDFQNGMYVESS